MRFFPYTTHKQQINAKALQTSQPLRLKSSPRDNHIVIDFIKASVYREPCFFMLIFSVVCVRILLLGSDNMLMNGNEYLSVIQSIKSEIKSAQYKAALSVNRELIMLYYNIGKIINEHKAWGNKFIDNLAADIKLEIPNVKGYSVRNLKYIWQNLQRLILMSNLCNRLLHKFRGGRTSCCLIK